MNILEAKKIESKNLKEAIRRWPRFFETPAFVDDQNFLEKYGIQIPEKKKFPLGYLKLWPQDFIVEEIAINEELQTVFPEKFLHTRRDFLPEDPIIYATLVKCGLSTLEAVEELVRMLNIDFKNFKYAGIKDKRAITSQLVSIKGSSAEELSEINSRYLFLKNIFSGNEGINLGELKGNQFTILIRTGPDFKKEEFLKRMKETEKNGFLNFFYLQRFGLPKLTAHHCGLCILKGDYEKTVFTAVCKPGEREPHYFKNVRKEIEKLWGNWDEIEGILESFPVTFREELKMVSHLKDNPKDFVGALNKTPKQIELWLEAFASFLYNQKISSYLIRNEKPPEKLPLILGEVKKYWLFYEDFLKKYGIFSVTFALKNLEPLKILKFRQKVIKTTEKIKILNYKVLPLGVVLNFNLPKGCYATAFLSHFFNLASGALPKGMSNLPIDTKANLGQPSLEEILNKFSEVISSPSWRLLWGIHG